MGCLSVALPLLLSAGLVRAADAPASASAAKPAEGLDEMFRRAQRRATNVYPREVLEDEAAGCAWQPETLCYRDSKTGREVWRMTDTPNIRNYYHNDIAMSPWSADGKYLGLTSWRLTRKMQASKELRALWMVVGSDGSRLRPTVNAEPYTHWSPLVPDTYYTFGGTRLSGVKSQNNVLYKVVVPEQGAATEMAPLITYPIIEKSSYGTRKLISADGKMLIAIRTDITKGWEHYQHYFIPSTIYPDADAKALLKDGYIINRDFGDYCPPYAGGHFHDCYLLGDGSWFYAIERSIGFWRMKTLGSAPDGGPKFTPDDGSHKFGEIIPEYVRKLGKINDPWGDNAQYPGHPAFDRWGKLVNIANYETHDAKGEWTMGCSVYDYINHRPLVDNWLPQTLGCSHCDWSAYADWCVVSVEEARNDPKLAAQFGVARIECFPYDKAGGNFVVCYTHNFAHGFKGVAASYDNYIRPAQSPDGTKVAWHSDFLNGESKPDCYWAVCYYPHPPTGLKAVAAGDGGVRIIWESPAYTKRGYPSDKDAPPPAREIRAYHIWRAKADKGPWEEVGAVKAEYKVNVARAIQEPRNLVFNDKPADGTWFYAVTSEEHSRLESDQLSEVLKVETADGGKKLSASVVQPAGQKDYWRTKPASPAEAVVTKANAPGCPQLTWKEPADAKVRYYNVYYSAQAAPAAIQANRIASLPVGTSRYIDWLADMDKSGFYAITAVDRQGNESEPAAAQQK